MFATLSRRHLSVAAIRNRGGSVCYYDECHEGLMRLLYAPRLIFDRATASVSSVHLWRGGGDDDLLASVCRFPKLSWLTMSGEGITDKGVQQLRSCRHLRYVLLDKTLITTKALANAIWLPCVEMLGLNYTGVDNEIWSLLSDSRNLWDLSIGGTRVTSLLGVTALKGLRSLCLNDLMFPDEELDHLQACRELEELFLNNSSISARGFAILGNLSTLRSICVGQTRMTDADVSLLQPLQQLEELIAYDTRITDSGLSELTKLSGLTFACLTGTNLTPDSVKHFQAFPSHVRIWIDQQLFDRMPVIERSRISCEVTPIDETNTNAT